MFLAFLIWRGWIFSKNRKDIFLFGVLPVKIFGQCGGTGIWTRQSKTIFAGGKGFALPRLLFENGGDLESAAQEGAGGMRGGFFSDFRRYVYKKRNWCYLLNISMNQSASYKIKCKNEDFQVTEVSLMPSLASKKPHRFTYFWLQKSGLTTFDVLDCIKLFFKLKFDDVANQGLKDEDAITEQLISVKKILSKKDITAFNRKHGARNKYSRIKHVIGYGGEPVKERMLHGNSFRIMVRNLESRVANNLLTYLSAHRHHYFINYYDNQRLGMPGGPYNTHLIGEAIVKKDWKGAYDHIKVTNNIPPDLFTKLENTTDYKEIFKIINPKKVSFFVSSYNSFLWNNQTSLLIEKNTKSKKHQFENVGYLYLPTTHSFQCPHICEAGGYEFVKEKFTVKRKVNNRNVVVATTIYTHDLENDELHRNKKKTNYFIFSADRQLCYYDNQTNFFEN